MKILQINLNKSRAAQDLMVQVMREQGATIALVAEPNRIPTGNWWGDSLGVAAIYWETGEPCTLIGRGEGFIIIEWKGNVIASVYFSPNGVDNKFKELLRELNRIIGSTANKKVLIGGDFNARSRGWDKTYNNRGHILEEWIRGKGMIVANKERDFTCVRAQGSSVVDLTLCTPTLMKKMES